MNEGTIGEIRLFSGAYPPQSWEFCDGQQLQIRDNPALYAILGTRYGGDDKGIFKLPKLAPLTDSNGGPPIRYIICREGIYPNMIMP